MSKRKHAIEAHYQSGVRLHGAGRLPEAEQVYRQVLAEEPRHADALHMLGVLASQCGQPQGAIACIDQAIAIKPSAALFHVNRAAALLALRQLPAAEASCREALRLKHNCAEAYQVLGHCLSDQDRAEEAVAAYSNAIRLKPELPDLYNSMGLALRQAGRLDEAAVALRQAVKRDPQTIGNLAGVLKELGRLDDAEAAYRAAIRANPEDAVAHLNLSIVLLLFGRYDEAWREYAWRFRAGAAWVPACDKPRWSGEPLAGRTLLIRGEQGLGDTIQFCRYARLAAERGPVVLEVQPGLRRLMASLLDPTRIVQVGDALPPFDVWCPLLDLPLLLGMDAPLPPYLAAEPERVALWRERIGGHGRTIGIAWQGNISTSAGRARAIPLHEFAPLSQVPGVRLISLQRGFSAEQIAAAAPGVPVETLGDDFDAGRDAFVDTAAVMQCLDLVITGDTAIGHVAGALGRPAWEVLQDVPDWRWEITGETSRWYPNTRVFRQTKRGDWASVFARIAQRLSA